MPDQRIIIDSSAGTLTGNEIVPLVQVGSAVTAGSFVVGTAYAILSVGTTNFTAIGAASNTVGVGFVATGVGSGTGTAGATSNVRTTTQSIANLASASGGGLYSQVISAAPTSAATGLTTWANQGSCTVADGKTGIILSGPNSVNNGAIRYKAAPATPYNIDVLVERFSTTATTYGIHFGWYDGTKIECFSLFTSGIGLAVYVLDYSALTSMNSAANVRFTSVQPLATSHQWWRIRDDGTNITFYMLPGGDYNNPVSVYTVAKASGYLSSYSNVFFGINQGGSGTMTGVLLSYTER